MSSQQQPPLTETIADKAKDTMENAKQTLSNAGQHIVDGIKYALHLDNAAGVKYAYVVGGLAEKLAGTTSRVLLVDELHVSRTMS